MDVVHSLKGIIFTLIKYFYARVWYIYTCNHYAIVSRNNQAQKAVVILVTNNDVSPAISAAPPPESNRYRFGLQHW